MATQVQFRGGTTTEHASFNGAAREVTVDTTKQTLVVQDGSTNGGFPLLGEKNADNVKVYFGTGDDLQIYHDGTYSYLKNTPAGGLYLASPLTAITNLAVTENIARFNADGAVELYFDASKKLETTADGVKISGHLDLEDDLHIRLGTGDDYHLWHSSNVNYLSTAGTFKITNSAAAETLAAFVPDGAVELYYNGGKKFETISNGVKVNDTIDIYHDGSHSYLKNTSGIQFINGNTIYMRTEDSSEDYFRATQNGTVELYYDGSKKLHTYSGGVEVTGLKILDSNKLKIGNAEDLEIYHDGSNSYINESGTGHLKIRSDDAIKFQKTDGSWIAIFNADASTDLYYDNSKKFETNSTGTKTWGGHIMTNGGTVTGGDLSFADASKAKFGDNSDLQIYHDGANSYINDTSTGEVYIQGDSFVAIRAYGSGETMGKFIKDGAVELYHNNVKKFETNTSGITITGNSYVTGNDDHPDNSQARFGTSNDLQIYHNGSNSFIENDTGILFLRAKAGENSINCSPDGAVNLYYDNSKKFETLSNGFAAYGWLNVFSGQADAQYGTSDGFHKVQSDAANWGLGIENSHDSSPYGLSVTFSDAAPDNNTQAAFNFADSTALRFVVWSDGDCDNHDNSYGGTSDVKLKENIVDANSQWDDVKAVKVRTFNFKTDTPSDKRLGVVAQEIETVSPGLVDEHPDMDKKNNNLGTTTKSVKYSILYMKAFKALQEAMAKIETLEAKVAALEAG